MTWSRIRAPGIRRTFAGRSPKQQAGVRSVETYKVITGVGFVIFLIGAALGFMGTTSTGLFVFYGALAIAGLGVMALGNKMRQDAEV